MRFIEEGIVQGAEPWNLVSLSGYESTWHGGGESG